MCINNNSTSMYQGSSLTRVYIVVEVEEADFLVEVVLPVTGITGRTPLRAMLSQWPSKLVYH